MRGNALTTLMRGSRVTYRRSTRTVSRAGRSTPRIAFVVMIEFGESGGRAAGPAAQEVAAKILELLGPDLNVDAPEWSRAGRAVVRGVRLPFTQTGWAILAAVAVLAALGLLTIYVADTAYAGRHDGPGNALRQLIAFGVSAGAGLVVLRIGYQRIGRYSYVIFLVAVLALLPLLLAKLLHSSFGGLTTPRNGAYRWIRLPGFDASALRVDEGGVHSGAGVVLALSE